MMCLPQPHRCTRRRRVLRLSTLAGVLLAATAAQAVVSTTAPPESDGSFLDNSIRYGNTGSMFELIPRLFVQGLGNAGNPQTVAGGNPALQYVAPTTVSGISGDGTGLMTIEYTLRNTSAVQSFNQLRFMLFANPDGDGVNFSDTLSETWGGAAPGDPARREGRAFDAVNGILTRVALNNNLTEVSAPQFPAALDAACTGGAGCDANVALQWNLDPLGPGQVMRVRVGLSDDGQALSSRFLTISSVSDPGTVLTFSGNVTAVPEPGTTALMLAGLLGVGFLAQRRRPAL